MRCLIYLFAAARVLLCAARCCIVVMFSSSGSLDPGRLQIGRRWNWAANPPHTAPLTLHTAHCTLHTAHCACCCNVMQSSFQQWCLHSDLCYVHCVGLRLSSECNLHVASPLEIEAGRVQCTMCCELNSNVSILH